MPRVCMGGTFDVLHDGHRLLIDAALKVGDEGVFIGVTSEEMAGRSRTRKVRPLAERIANVEAFVRSRGAADRVEVAEITTPEGRAFEPAFDAIVVTAETEPRAREINRERGALGLAPLRVVVVEYALADDGRPIKATRVREGEIDANGRLLRSPRVAVGSANPVKVEAVRRALSRLHASAHVAGFAVPSKVSEQPLGRETWEGALERARAALEADPQADFGVGIEAGLFRVEAIGDHFDVQVCAVIDRGGRVTYGEGPGFAYPRSVSSRILADGLTVGDVLGEISGDAEIGRKGGAIGHLTRGALDRTELTEMAVLMAWVPRVRGELYER